MDGRSGRMIRPSIFHLPFSIYHDLRVAPALALGASHRGRYAARVRPALDSRIPDLRRLANHSAQSATESADVAEHLQILAAPAVGEERGRRRPHRPRVSAG